MMVTQSLHTKFSSIIRGKKINNMKFSSRVEDMLNMSCRVTLINVKSYIYITHEVKSNQLKDITVHVHHLIKKEKTLFHILLICK